MPSDAARQIEDLRRKIRRHDHLYYVLTKPEISDREYDRLLKKLREVESEHPDLITPDSPTQRVGGEPIDGFKHVTHAVRMLSIDNTYDEKQLRQFDERLAKELGEKTRYEYVADPKIDGVAIALHYEDGVLTLGATRGNGTTGDDITHSVRTIPSVPLRLTGNEIPRVLEVRGEVCWPWDAFNRYNEERQAAGEPAFANPRNATAGSLKQLDPRKIDGRGLQFVAHSLGQVDPLQAKTHAALFDQLADWGIPVGRHRWLFKSIDAVISHLHEWDARRLELPFATDGLVIKINDFAQRDKLGTTARAVRWAIAYKYESEQAETKLLNVEWQVGKLGTITPVAKLEPVLLAGTTVSSASLHNPVQIERLDLRDGDTVVVEKAGEIIPQVIAVAGHQRRRGAKRVAVPTACPSCNAPAVRDKPDPALVAFRCENADCPDAYKVIQRKSARETCVRCHQPVTLVQELPTLKCENPACPAQLKARLAHFAARNAMDIEGLGEALVDTLVERRLLAGIPDIYCLESHREALVDLEGLGQKSVGNLLKGIEVSKGRPLSRLLSAINIPHVGTTTGEQLATHFGTIDALLTAMPEDIYGALSEPGNKTTRSNESTQKTPQAIHAFFKLPAIRAMIDELRELGVNLKQPKQTGTEGPLTGKTVVVTGTLEDFSRSEIQARIKELGGKVAGAVSGKTDLVVVGATPGKKADDAKKLNVPIIDEKAFQDEYGNR